MTKAATLDGRAVGTAWTVGFSTTDAVFGLPRKHERQTERARGNGNRTAYRYVVRAEPIATRPVRCIQVAAASGCSSPVTPWSRAPQLQHRQAIDDGDVRLRDPPDRAGRREARLTPPRAQAGRPGHPGRARPRPDQPARLGPVGSGHHPAARRRPRRRHPAPAGRAPGPAGGVAGGAVRAEGRGQCP